MRTRNEALVDDVYRKCKQISKVVSVNHFFLKLFISCPEANFAGRSYADVESRISLSVARRCREMGRFVKFIFR